MAKYLRKGCCDLIEVASDNDHVKDDDANSENIKVVKIGLGEITTILDRLVNLKHLSKEEKLSCRHEFKLDKIRVLSKKQNHISDHFMLQQSLYDRFY